MSIGNSSIIKASNHRPMAEVSSAMEEFSFPVVAAEQERLCQLTFPHFASSPLRFLSSTSNHMSAAIDVHSPNQRSKSFSSLEDLKLQDKISLAEFNKEERMDMLWEDFNEEIRQNPCDGKDGDEKSLDLSRTSTNLDGKRRLLQELFFEKAVHRHRHLFIRCNQLHDGVKHRCSQKGRRLAETSAGI